jgi:hypothetical protein
MTLRQPTERHGGNAGNDEEVTIMVSRAIASLDVWLAQADQLLRERHEQSLSPASAGEWLESRRETPVTLSTFEQGLATVLDHLCRRPGRWVLIAHIVGHEHRYWQALAYEDGSLKAEVVSNNFLHGPDRLTAQGEEALTALGWAVPDSSRPNWHRLEPTTSPPIGDVASQAVATLRQVFGVAIQDRLVLTTFDLAHRENTPASQRIENGDEECDAIDVLNDSTVRPSFLPMAEPWAPYYRSLWPDHANPPSRFVSWKYGSTGVDHARELRTARERAREQWLKSAPGSKE